MTAARYREYLRTFGITDAGDRVAELRDRDLGRVRFFAYVGEGGLRLKAAVTPGGIVTPGGHAGDDWYGFLSEAPDAMSAAERIAWLETDASTGPHAVPSAPAAVLSPHRRPPPGLDPAQWALVSPPALAEHAPGGLTLATWLLRDGRTPERWTVTARGDATSAIDRVTASDLLVIQAGGPEAAAAAATERALRLLSSGTDDERLWALDQVSEIGAAAATPLIAALLANLDVSPTVRLQAAGTLARLADPGAVPPLARALRGDPAPPVRRACAQALGRLGGPGVVSALAEAASAEPDAAVRVEVVQALVTQGRAARAALTTVASGDPDARIRALARESVQSLE